MYTCYCVRVFFCLSKIYYMYVLFVLIKYTYKYTSHLKKERQNIRGQCKQRLATGKKLNYICKYSVSLLKKKTSETSYIFASTTEHTGIFLP